MKLRTRLIARCAGVGVMLVAVGVVSLIQAGSRRAVGPSGGGGHHASGRVSHGASPRGTATVRAQPAPRAGATVRAQPVPRATAAARGYPAPRGTANGIARYGYGNGYGYGYGYGYGGGYPYWGVGWYGGYWGAGWYGGYWGWPYYGYASWGPWYYGPWYGPYDDSYEVTVEEPKPPGPAIVETDVTPSKAKVVLDGESVGYASDYNGRWDTLSVSPGSHTIAFQLNGYRTLEIAFEATSRGNYVFNDTLVPGEGEDRRTLPAPSAAAPPENAPPRISSEAIGRLRVRAEPPDAAVYLDGEYLGLGAELGRIHGALAVPAGAHRLDAVRPGFVSASRAIDVGTTEVVSVELTLEPER